MTERKKLTSIVTLVFMLAIFSGCTKDSDENLPGGGNNLSLGVSSKDLLSEDRFTSMKVEVVYVKDNEPAPGTISDIKSFLEEHTNKPNGISVVVREISSLGGDTYTISEINDIEEEIRSAYNSGEEIAVFILFVDGESATQEENKLILGTAYKNTSVVIYNKTIRELSGVSGISKRDIESTTIKHEFGHLFGLVDNGSPSQSVHEDTENKSHCNVETCIMIATVEFGTGTLKMLQKGSKPIGFDPKCLEDLKANGGK